jgi:ABC-type antimicrobial peptide transport system permease subunit
MDQPGAQPAVYTSYLQQPRYYRGPAVGMFVGMTFLMRPDADPDAVLAAARRAAADITPDRPLDEVGTVQSHLYALAAERRNYVAALDTFALLATLLAIVGIHGVAMHVVVGRAKEIAVRRALGARGREILALVALPTLSIAAAGLLAGAAGALAAARLLAPQLSGVAPTNASTFVAVSAALLGVAAVGCAAPMRRALRGDSIVRLRAE